MVILLPQHLWNKPVFHDGYPSYNISFVMNLFLRVENKNHSCIRETQENSIEFQVQSSLPYILIPMVRANYCAPYPKWPWVIHEANMWCPCCLTSLCSSSFYILLLSPVISLVTTPSSCDWCDSVTDNP